MMVYSMLEDADDPEPRLSNFAVIVVTETGRSARGGYDATHVDPVQILAGVFLVKWRGAIILIHEEVSTLYS